MTQNKASRALLYLILGFVAANLALAMRMNSTAVFRAAVSGTTTQTNSRLAAIELNQRTLIARQRLAMQKLKIDLVEPATQP